jgi:hypothetical protein
MPVNRDQFDADEAAELQATTDYITAVDAFIALPPVVDLTQEDSLVMAKLNDVNAARSRIPVAPPPPPAPSTPAK